MNWNATQVDHKYVEDIKRKLTGKDIAICATKGLSYHKFCLTKTKARVAQMLGVMLVRLQGRGRRIYTLAYYSTFNNWRFPTREVLGTYASFDFFVPGPRYKTNSYQIFLRNTKDMLYSASIQGPSNTRRTSLDRIDLVVVRVAGQTSWDT